MAKKKVKVKVEIKKKKRKSKIEKEETPTPPPPPPPPEVQERENNMPRYFRDNETRSVSLGWYCNPRSIVFTPEGQLWISDPPRHRILRYYFNDDKIYERLDDLHTNCKVYFLKTIDKSLVMGIGRRKDQDGFIKFRLPGPKLEKEWNEKAPEDLIPSEKKEGKKAKAKPSKKAGPKSKKGKTDVIEMRFRFEVYEKPKYFIREDQLLDFAFENGILYVLYHPDFKLETFLMGRMFRIRTRLQGTSDQRIELRNSGGIVVFKSHMYLLANNPPRLMIFDVKHETLTDRVLITQKLTVGQFHLTNPYGLTCDWLGNLLVSDESDRCIYVYNRAGLFLGAVNSEVLHGSAAPGFMSVSHNGTLAFIDNGNNRCFTIIPLERIHTYDRKKFLAKHYQPQKPFSFLTYQRGKFD